ncbi:hypothetical protein [Paraglaciecola sp. L1A13]|uniref:hypothetical protein n=1 Tax=Paraglaciecola sp. L1A13 TaxID=2686359 RepID=UPI00131DC40B|nr:hypothetical protein [Paraglaciecola sp. L1A13]
MKSKFVVLWACVAALCGCHSVQPLRDSAVALDNQLEAPAGNVATVKGRWLTEENGAVMLDPQTSGLTVWNGKLISLSDRSADPSQRLQLHVISSETALVSPDIMAFELSDALKASCFASYIQENPDLEALVAVPNEPGIFLTITEDASDHRGLSPECAAKYGHSGSVDYPFLLVRLAVQKDRSVLMTHVRPLMFADGLNLANFPNDGIEGLALSEDGQLYLGLEKDAAGGARVFTTNISAEFWQQEDFIPMRDTQVKLPSFKHGNHPINALEVYQRDGHRYLFAAARNDEQLWVIDLAGQQDALVVDLNFFAQIYTPNKTCSRWEPMDNASIEGLTVMDDTIWMVNDPWKAVYLKNIQCEQNRAKFEKMAPLLFSLPIQETWFR